MHIHDEDSRQVEYKADHHRKESLRKPCRVEADYAEKAVLGDLDTIHKQGFDKHIVQNFDQK